MVIDYVKECYVFGCLIGGNQVIKYKLVDMYVKNEVVCLNCYFGVWVLLINVVELLEVVVVVCLVVSEVYWFVLKENIQMYGGMGFIWEVDCYFFYCCVKLFVVQVGVLFVWKEKFVCVFELKNVV